MDPSFNELDNIRSPDEVKVERLLQDNRSEFDKQIDEAMYLSIQDFRDQEELYKNYEAEILKESLCISIERRGQFKGLLFDLSKLIRYDEDIKEIYNIIEPIIDSYCGQVITHYEFDNLTYDRIFKVIGNIRTHKENIDILKQLLKKSEL